jgi:hypothetical protein
MVLKPAHQSADPPGVQKLRTVRAGVAAALVAAVVAAVVAAAVVGAVVAAVVVGAVVAAAVVGAVVAAAVVGAAVVGAGVTAGAQAASTTAPPPTPAHLRKARRLSSSDRCKSRCGFIFLLHIERGVDPNGDQAGSRWM